MNYKMKNDSYGDFLVLFYPKKRTIPHSYPINNSTGNKTNSAFTRDFVSVTDSSWFIIRRYNNYPTWGRLSCLIKRTRRLRPSFILGSRSRCAKTLNNTSVLTQQLRITGDEKRRKLVQKFL